MQIHHISPTLATPRATAPVSQLDLQGRPPRVVIDTSVVMSALVFGGEVSKRLRRAWRHGFCHPLVCPSTLLDLFNQISHSDLGFSQQEQHQMLQQFLPYVVKVRGVENFSRPEPSGLLFVQLAIASGAQVLVTGDAPLLAMAQASTLPCQIVAPEPFLHLLRESAIKPAPLRVAPRRSH